MSILQQKIKEKIKEVGSTLKEKGSSLRENFQAISDGKFFSTSLQTQLAILEILRNLFKRVGMVDNRMRLQEAVNKQLIDMLDTYLQGVQERMNNVCLLEQKTFDHLQILLRHVGASKIGEDSASLNEKKHQHIETLLIEFLLPWLKEKTAMDVGANKGQFVEEIYAMGFKRISDKEGKEVRSLLGFIQEGILPAQISLLKIDTTENDWQVLQEMPVSSQPEILLSEFGRKGDGVSPVTQSQQEKFIKYMRDIGYVFSISLVHLPDGRVQFVANMPVRISDTWGNTFCFRESALFEKAYGFLRAILQQTV